MGELTLFLPLLVIMGAFMFFASRRQKKAMQATVDLHDSLTIGDEVMTTAGLYGTVAGLSETKVEVEIAPGVVVSMLKMAIKDRITADDDDLDDDDLEDDDLEDDEYEDDDAHDHQVEASSAVEIDRPTVTASEAKADPDRLTKD